jgi:hypothetical protein
MMDDGGDIDSDCWGKQKKLAQPPSTKQDSPTEIRTQDTTFKVSGDNHFTMGELIFVAVPSFKDASDGNPRSATTLSILLSCSLMFLFLMVGFSL